MFRDRNRTRPKTSSSLESLSSLVLVLIILAAMFTLSSEKFTLVKTHLPIASEARKLNLDDYTIVNLNIGKPLDKSSEETLIQYYNGYIGVEDIPLIVAPKCCGGEPCKKEILLAIINADKDTKMGIIHDIQNELIEYQVYKVAYAATK